MFSLIQQLSKELAQATFSSANISGVVNAAAGNGTAPLDLQNLKNFNFQLSDFIYIWRFIASFSVARDWIKLFLLGSVLETIRRFAGTIWRRVVDSFFLTATFESDDDAYNWMMIWISRQPGWRTARDIQISTKGWGLTINDYSSKAIAVPGEADSSFDKRSLNFLPSFGLTQTCWYRNRWMRFTRSRRALQDMDTVETLTINILTTSQRVLYELLLEAKQLYEKEEQHKVSIYTASNYYDWRRSGSRPKRPLESIVLESGIKEMVLSDAQEFMASEKWYTERGLPYRRGYLFYGCPGSGKTSLVHAIAGELNLDIYVINLSKKGLDDTGLGELVADLPARSVALIEEIDAAFLHGVSRDNAEANSSSDSKSSGGVTLSGLLTSIDGIQASEGRLLFATTNRYHALDPALIRAGRLDVHVEFTYAAQEQAEELFKRFYLATSDQDSDKHDYFEKADKPSSNSHSTTTKSIKSRYIPPKPEKLTEAERDALAAQFAKAIPDREFAMSSIQGLLLNYKNRPSEVIKEVSNWVEKERLAKIERERAKKIEEEKEKKEKERETKEAGPSAEVKTESTAEKDREERKETPTPPSVDI